MLKPAVALRDPAQSKHKLSSDPPHSIGRPTQMSNHLTVVRMQQPFSIADQHMHSPVFPHNVSCSIEASLQRVVHYRCSNSSSNMAVLKWYVLFV